MAYFLPTKENIAKRREDATENRPYDDGYEYEYQVIREYNWNVKCNSSKSYTDNYFFIERSGVMYYNELESRLF